MKQVVEGGGMFILLLHSCSGMDGHNEFKCFLIPKKQVSPNVLKIFFPVMNLDFLYLRSVQMFSSQLVSCFWRKVWVATSVWAEISLGNPGERQIIFYIQQELQIICHIKLLWGDLFDWHEFKAATTRQTSTKYSYVIVTVICFGFILPDALWAILEC